MVHHRCRSHLQRVARRRRDVVEAAAAFDSRHTGLSDRASRIHASLAAEQTRTALQDAHSEALTALVRNRFVLREDANMQCSSRLIL